MERLFLSKYNEKLKKIKIDEIESSRNDDSLTKEIYNIAINDLPDNIGNYSEEEMDEKIELKITSLEQILSSSINSSNLSLQSSLRKSNTSSNSDKTSASSDFHYKYNDNINILESYDNNNSSGDNLKRKIDITNIITGDDKRTMIEINKIPKKYNIKAFKEELNNKGFNGKYDYISFEMIDRYNSDSNPNVNLSFKKVYINFVDPLNIIMFCYLYQKKYFNFKGNINEIQYAEHISKKNIFRDSNNNLKNSYNNLKKNNSQSYKIEIPKEYLEFYKKVNPNDVCININDSYFGIDTFSVKKK